MKRFSFKILAVAAAVCAVCWLGCGGGDDNPADNNNRSNNNNNGGGSYDYVNLGGKKWMKKNLNIATTDSKCYGEGGEECDVMGECWTLSSAEIQANCNKYGRLYTWETAKSACQSIGMRLPSHQELDDLVTAAGGAKKLKTTNGWFNNGNGTNETGFSALPGGLRYYSGTFYGAGGFGIWWTATEGEYENSDKAVGRSIGYDDDEVGVGSVSKEFFGLLSVRCVKDD